MQHELEQKRRLEEELAQTRAKSDLEVSSLADSLAKSNQERLQLLNSMKDFQRLVCLFFVASLIFIHVFSIVQYYFCLTHFSFIAFSPQIDAQQQELRAVQDSMRLERDEILKETLAVRQEHERAEQARALQESDLLRLTESLTHEADAMKSDWESQDLLAQLEEIEEENKRLLAELEKEDVDILPTPLRPTHIPTDSPSVTITVSSSADVAHDSQPPPTESQSRKKTQLRWQQATERLAASAETSSDPTTFDVWMVTQDPKVQEILRGKSTADQYVVMQQLSKQQARRQALAANSHPERLSIKDKRDRFSMRIKNPSEA